MLAHDPSVRRSAHVDARVPRQIVQHAFAGAGVQINYRDALALRTEPGSRIGDRYYFIAR